MEDIFGLILGLGLAVVIAIIVIFYQTRRKKRTWKGVVMKVSSSIYSTHEDGGFEREYVISYQTEAGKRGKFRLQEERYRILYSELKVGDHLEKTEGEFFPRAIR